MTDAVREALPNAHRFVSLTDGVTHFRKDGDGPAVLLIHGATVPAWEFDRFVPYLTAAGYSCYRYDLFGHGYSDRPRKPHDYRLFVDQAKDFIAAAELPRQFAVLGHSLGSIVAARLALDLTDRVTRLVLAAPMLEFQGPGFSVVLPRIPVVGSLLVHGWAVPMLRRRRTRRYAAIEDGRFVQFFNEQLAYPGFGRSLLSLLKHGALGDQRSVFDAVAQSGVAAMILRGTDDRIVTAKAFDEVHRRMPHARRVDLYDTAHAMLLTDPDRVAPHVVSFIRDEPLG